MQAGDPRFSGPRRVQVREHDDDGCDVVCALLILQPAVVGSGHQRHRSALNILILGHLPPAQQGSDLPSNSLIQQALCHQNHQYRRCAD